MSPGRHKKPSRANKKARVVAGSAIASALAVAPVALTAAPADAAGSVWNRVAQCESSGNWQINTGNGYYGGLQFSHSTWQAYGGGAYANNANGATRAEQITIARRTLGSQGPGAWPVCGRKAGLTRANGNADTGGWTSSGSGSGSSSSSYKVKYKTTPKPSPRADGEVDYTVVRGDTLFKIASKKHVSGGWKTVWNKNRSRVHNPNLIYVGQRLDVR